MALMVLMLLMSPAITHLVAVEMIIVMGEVFRIGMIAVMRIRPVVAVAGIVVTIYMTVEIMMAMKPRSGSDENAVVEPFRSVVSPWCAVVWRKIVVAVWTYGLGSDGDRYLGRRGGRGDQERGCGESGQNKQLP